MPAERPHSPSSRRYIVLAVKLVVSVALLGLLFSRVDAGRLWDSARRASVLWLSVAMGVYLVNVGASVWRWWLLLEVQDVLVRPMALFGSFLVALFFNNFLPSNIGGDVIRIADTAKPARSKTLATTVVLLDRVMGLMGLVLVAALGATIVARASSEPSLVWPSWLWAGFLIGIGAAVPAFLSPAGLGRLLRPLMVLHPEWIGGHIDSFTAVLTRFSKHPVALVSCFGGAVFVQATLIAFYAAVAFAFKVNITAWELAVIVPVSFLVQMAPVSVNGFGVREATFSFYFSRLGLPIESALLLSFGATALMMLFSLSGAAVYLTRGRH
jgi:uncharacterized membrane protein YbhN (UPF0104 family)